MVVGGFLGSGKTTLLNHLLTHNDGRRLAVLVNDFGTVNIDAALIASRGADTLTLSNGCVCCQLGGDLTDALIRVIDGVPRPDAIVIEASGVADPWRIAQAGLSDPALALDGVVVVVDAASVLAQAADPLLSDTVLRQLEAADLLVVNQCDRVPAAALGTLRAWLSARLPRTPRFETTFAQVPGQLLGAELLPPQARAPALDCAATGCEGKAHSQHREDPRHGALFDTWITHSEGSYRSGDLRALMRAMPAGILRLKGVIRTEAGWTVLQFAGRHGSLRPWPSAIPGPAGTVAGTLVAIGLRGHLPVETLHNALIAAAAADGAPSASTSLAGT